MPGPPKKPQELKLIAGTDRPDRRADTPVKAELIEAIPDVPIHFTDYQTKVYYVICGQLMKQKMLYVVDFEYVKLYCHWAGVAHEAQEQLNYEGLTIDHPQRGMIKNPYVTILNEATDKLLKIGARFGFTPSERQKISGENEEKEVNPFEEFMKRVQSE